MQNRLIQSDNAYKWLLPLEQALGKKQFEQLVADPKKVLYQLAKEKNIELLKQIVHFNASITNPTLQDLLQKKNIQPFAFHITKNGYSQLYELAKQASLANETFVIDFLLDHFPDLNKKDIILAYAENNDTINVSRLLKQYQYDNALMQTAGWGYALNDNKAEIGKLNQRLPSNALIPLNKDFTEQIKNHLIYNTTYSTPHIPVTPLKSEFINRVYHFFRKEKNISLTLFQKEFPINSTSHHEYLWIIACTAFYNHHIILNHLANNHLAANLAARINKANVYLNTAIKGGSYESICVLLNQHAELESFTLNTVHQDNLLLLDKVLSHTQQAASSKKDLVKNNASPTDQLPNEIATRKNLYVTLSNLYIYIRNGISLQDPITEPTNNTYLCLKQNHHIRVSLFHILKTNAKNVTASINDIMQNWLALFNHPDKHYSLHELLNKPIRQLLNEQHHAFEDEPIDATILTYANSCITGFIYLRAILEFAPDALQFIELNALTKSPAIIETQVGVTLPLSFIECLLHDALIGRSLLIQHEKLFDLADPHQYFEEKYKPLTSNDDLNISRFYSIAIACIQSPGDIASTFIKKFSPLIKTYIENPSLLLSLLNNNAGLEWLAQNIQALKNVPHNTFYFADIGQRLLDQPALAKLIIADEDIAKAMPNIYRKQIEVFTHAQQAVRVNNKKSLEKQQELVKQLTQKPTIVNNDATLIKAIENRGYLLSANDFAFTQKNGQYELVFASTSDNPFGALKNKFKEKAKSIAQEYKQLANNKMHQFVLRFSSKQIGNVISIFNSYDGLEKKASYHGCVNALPNEQIENSTSKASPHAMNKEKWQQAIQYFFCESPQIQLTEIKAKGNKLSFAVTYTQTGKNWALKRDAATNSQSLLITDNTIKQFFVTSLTEHLQKTKLATVKHEKSGNQQKIIITPIANEPPDVTAIQAKNFDDILKHNDQWMPTIYDTVASKRVTTVDLVEQDFFKEFHQLCKERNIKARLVKKDGTVGPLATDQAYHSDDIDYVTDCEDMNILTALGLTYIRRAKNLKDASLFKGKLKSGKSIDMVVTSYKGNEWAHIVAKSADTTRCSLCIAMHNDAFFLLDPLNRGLNDYKDKLIYPTEPNALDDIIKKDPIRILRVIKYKIKDEKNTIDPAYQEALLRWPAEASTFDIVHFSIKLLDEMKHPKTPDEMKLPHVSAWIQHLKDYGILEKVYLQTNNESNASIIATIRGQIHSQYSIKPNSVFRPAPKVKNTPNHAKNTPTL